MPIIKSAKKRVKVASKAAARNSRTKRTLRGVIKTFNSSLKGSDGKKLSSAHSKAQSALDKAGKKHILHKNKVARKKRQLAKAAKAASLSNKTATKSAPKKKTATTKRKPSKKS